VLAREDETLSPRSRHRRATRNRRARGERLQRARSIRALRARLEHVHRVSCALVANFSRLLRCHGTGCAARRLDRSNTRPGVQRMAQSSRKRTSKRGNARTKTQSSARSKKKSSSTRTRRAASANGNGAARGDAIALLKADHREVEGWFKEFEKARSDDRKQELADKICRALRVHTQIEDE